MNYSTSNEWGAGGGGLIYRTDTGTATSGAITIDSTETRSKGLVEIARNVPIDDLVIRSDGDGRTVEAYAAVFDQPTEITDQHGHYFETIERTAFDGALKRGSTPAVLFNHGLDVYGRPSDRFATPIGTHVEARADGRGLRTVARISATPLGDEVLTLMRDGAITGFSFSGSVRRSRTVAPSKGDDLPTIVRQELSFKEYGPAVFRAYDGARVLALRSDSLVDEVDRLTPGQREALLDVLQSRGSEVARNADDAARSTGADFDRTRRLMAARLRGILE